MIWWSMIPGFLGGVALSADVVGVIITRSEAYGLLAIAGAIMWSASLFVGRR